MSASPRDTQPSAEQRYLDTWTRWQPILEPYKDIVALSRHFPFTNGGKAIDDDTISKTCRNRPKRKDGKANLYVLMGGIRYRNHDLIPDVEAFIRYLDEWAIKRNETEWRNIWTQIETGIRKYEAELQAEAALQAEAEKQRAPSGLRRRWLLIGAALMLFGLALIGLAFNPLAEVPDQRALRVLNTLHDMYQITLGGVPTEIASLAPDAIYATATAIGVTGTAVARRRASPTIVPSGPHEVSMVYVEGGCFFVGNYSQIKSAPVFWHCVESFWIDEFKVSNAQYRAVMGVNPPSRSCEDNGWEFCADRPVEMITWPEARDYCAARGGRLPDELEWEYAGRGPLSPLYPWGNALDLALLDVQGQDVAAMPVIQTVYAHVEGRSWVGVAGLLGGVQEWTNSLWGQYPYAPGETRDSPDADAGDRVVRGTSFALELDDLDYVPLYVRDSFGVNTRMHLIGMRCARDA